MVILDTLLSFITACPSMVVRKGRASCCWGGCEGKGWTLGYIGRVCQDSRKEYIKGREHSMI